MVGNSKASVLVRLEFNELFELVSGPQNKNGDSTPALTKGTLRRRGAAVAGAKETGAKPHPGRTGAVREI